MRASCADTQINTNCVKDTKGLQGFYPWSPPRGGARGQSSLRAGACRPREKRARSITGREMKALGKEPCMRRLVGSALDPLQVLQRCRASGLSITVMASTDFM